VVAALLYNNKLYVANVGDSRALLCAQVWWHDGRREGGREAD
jgi:serine/threonine protein phosphatase PrpC